MRAIFLKAIEENPKDIINLLAFADWLEESGNMGNYPKALRWMAENDRFPFYRKWAWTWLIKYSEGGKLLHSPAHAAHKKSILPMEFNEWYIEFNNLDNAIWFVADYLIKLKNERNLR